MITGILVYINIGSIIWLILDGLGIIDNTYAARTNTSSKAMVLATLMMIFAWPVFVFTWVRGMLT